MHHSLEYSIEAWPGIVRIHSGYETKNQQTIELSPEQVPEFIRVLNEQAGAAVELGNREEEYRREMAVQRAGRAVIKGE